MLKFLIALLSDGSSISSARLLNIYGAIILGAVYIADFVLHKQINIDATTIMAMYFGGVYGISKGLTAFKDKYGNSIERKDNE